MKVYLVYNGDGWLSKQSLSLVAVCESYEKAVELLIDDLSNNYDVISCDTVDDEDYDEDTVYLEDYLDELEKNGQILGCGFGYFIQDVYTDEIL